MLSFFRRYDGYQIAIFLSSLSMGFGILREFLIVGLLGFTTKNDLLQIYLSIFYTIGLTIDAMRLSCLNLYSVLPLRHIIFSASLIALPFSVLIGSIMNYSTGDLDNKILFITILGSYLNLIAALLITYKQRTNVFLPAQIINVLPNFILIPGILLCYLFAKTDMVAAIVVLTASIPLIQCVLLFLLPSPVAEKIDRPQVSYYYSIFTFVRHFSAMIGEQLFQIITRSAFFNYGPGYLSIFAMTIRVYSAFRFILIDSYIGSKLATWKKELQNFDYHLLKMINSTSVCFMIAFIAFLISIHVSNNLIQASFQIVVLLIFGFYFSTLVRIIYFKINHYENNSILILRFASYELFFAGIAFLISKQSNYPLFALIWLGYIVKPFAQLLFLRKRFLGLTNPS